MLPPATDFACCYAEVGTLLRSPTGGASNTASFLAVAMARFFPFLPPRSASFSPQRSRVAVDAERSQDVLRSLHQQRAQIRVALLADVHLRFALPGVSPARLQSQIAAHIATLAETMRVNLSRPLHYQTPRLLSHLAFAVFLLSFGYVAVQMVFASERRLLSIENELEVARQLQFSILPTSIPEVQNLRTAVAYRPMTAVAGDFYELHLNR
jgi:hypothetical protein